MRNAWIGSVAALALACTVGIGAQTTASPATSTGQTRQDTVTVTGCLKAADAMGGATGTSGSTTAGTSSTAGSSSDRFMLANATMGTASSASTGTSGTATAGSTASTTPGTSRTGSASSAAGSSYTLDGDASELRRHMNHQVEIKGRLDSSAGMNTASRPGTTGAGTTATGTTATGTTSNPTGTSATGSTATGTTAGRDAHSSAAQTLRVESVKMIAATCP
jgi:hypothetical protein